METGTQVKRTSEARAGEDSGWWQQRKQRHLDWKILRRETLRSLGTAWLEGEHLGKVRSPAWASGGDLSGIISWFLP